MKIGVFQGQNEGKMGVLGWQSASKGGKFEKFY